MTFQHTTLMLNDGITLPQLKEEVKQLQTLLNGFGLLKGAPIDGLFGKLTENAVRQFQGKRILEVDGIVGRLTWAKVLGVEETDIELLPRPGVSFGGKFSTTYGAAEFADELEEIGSRGYEAIILAAAEEFGFQPSLIAGIGSRESNWGLLLKPLGPTGTGDFSRPLLSPGLGHGRGLMQIDDRAHPAFIATGKWKDATENIRYGCGVLADNRKFFEGRLSGTSTLLLRATVAAYNAGAGNVKAAINAGRDVDVFTAGGDYSQDVLNRAGWFQKFAEWE